MLQEKRMQGMKKHLRIKNLLSWQKILSNRQIAADIEGK